MAQLLLLPLRRGQLVWFDGYDSIRSSLLVSPWQMTLRFPEREAFIQHNCTRDVRMFNTRVGPNWIVTKNHEREVAAITGKVTMIVLHRRACNDNFWAILRLAG